MQRLYGGRLVAAKQINILVVVVQVLLSKYY
jgi:hypothetical protein